MDLVSEAWAAEAAESFGLHDALPIAGAVITLLLAVCAWLFIRWHDAEKRTAATELEAADKRIEDCEQTASDALGRADRYANEANAQFRALEARIADCVHKDDLASMRSEFSRKLDEIGKDIKEGLQRVSDKLDTKADKD